MEPCGYVLPSYSYNKGDVLDNYA